MDEAIYEEWLEWMQNVHIPLVMATGFFNAYRILKVVDSPNEGVTCCIQYNADTFGNYNQFYTEHLPMLQAIHQQRYENKFVLFNTVMESINEG